MQTEVKYKIRNWSEYNRAFIQRGSITVWMEQESLKKWYCSSHTCLVGRPQTFSDDAILLLLTLREVFKLTLRSLHGFAKSLFEMMGVNLVVPSYTQISRRGQTLEKHLKKLFKGKKTVISYLIRQASKFMGKVNGRLKCMENLNEEPGESCTSA